MEERAPPTTTTADLTRRHPDETDNNEEEFEECDNINDWDHHNGSNNMQLVSSTSASRRPHETYIIQIPKDQIYRVPPPENAEIVQRYQNPVHETRGRRRRCAYWFLSIVFVAAFLISVLVSVHHFTLSPKPPTFAVHHIVYKPPPSPPTKKNAAGGFHVSVDTGNPNSVNDLAYQQGSASLVFNSKQIASGHFPPLHNQPSAKTDSVDVVVTASSSSNLPKDVVNGKPSSKKPLNFKLEMSVPVKMKTWLWTKTAYVKVECEFEVDSVGDNSKVLSQKCNRHA